MWIEHLVDNGITEYRHLIETIETGFPPSLVVGTPDRIGVSYVGLTGRRGQVRVSDVFVFLQFGKENNFEKVDAKGDFYPEGVDVYVNIIPEYESIPGECLAEFFMIKKYFRDRRHIFDELGEQVPSLKGSLDACINGCYNKVMDVIVKLA